MKKTAIINKTVSCLCAVSLAAGSFALPNEAFAEDTAGSSSAGVSVQAAEHTVTFETNGGSEIQPITVADGDKLTLPASPTKDGEKFLRWYTDADLKTAFDSDQAITGDITLYARWFTPVTQDGVTYDQPLDAEIFNTSGGALESGNYVLTDDINIPETQYFTIHGNRDVKLHLNGHNIECNNSTTAFNVICGELTVTDNEDGTKGSINCSGNAFSMASPQASTINLYNILCKSGESPIYSVSTFGASINIYSGEFSPLTASSEFTIVETFDNFPTALKVYGGKFNGIIAKPNTDLDITITGGLFPRDTLTQEGLNWDSNGEYKAAYNFEENMMEVSYYGTEYFLNGHGVTPTPDRVKYGDPLTEPEKPTDPDWAFAGWYMDKECTCPMDFDSYPNALQFKLYAKWEAKAYSSIEINTPPTKTVYKEGDEFDPTGLVVTAIYNTGDTEVIPYAGNEADFSFSPSGRLAPTDTGVEISWCGFTAQQPVTVEPKVLESVTLNKGSAKVAYFINDSYSLIGVEALLTYDNGDTEVVSWVNEPDSFSFSPAKFLTSGDVDVTVYYLGYPMTDEVYVFREAVSQIEIKTPPTKTAYKEGDQFDPTGLVLKATYNSGNIRDIPYEGNEWEFSFSPEGRLSPTDTEVEISFRRLTANQQITVEPKKLESVALATIADKTTYFVNESYSPDGLVVLLTYDNGDTATVEYADEPDSFSFSPAQFTTSGIVKVTISYLGHTVTQNVQVVPVTVSQIALKTPPAKTAYVEGDKFDPTGLVITATYNNGTTRDIPYAGNEADFAFSPDGGLALTDTVVGISYGGVTVQQAVTVEEKKPETVSTIAIKTPPIKTSYYVGEKFDPTGLVLTVNYSTGRTAEAAYSAGNAGFTFSPDGSLSLNDARIEISYGGAVTALDITVRKRSGGNSGSTGGSGGRRDNAAASKEPLLVNGKQTTWSELKELLSQGDVTAELNDVTSVPADVIQALRDSRSKLTLLHDSTAKWTIDGAKLTGAHSADLTLVRTLSQRPDGLAGTEAAQFSANGTDVAELTLTVGNAGSFANVYVTADGKCTLAGVYRIGANGEVTLNITVKGDYIVMAHEYSAMPGDANNDGVLNALDAAAILKEIVGIGKRENAQMVDFNGDGVINALDASAILRQMLLK